MKIIFLDVDGVLNSLSYFKTEEHQLKRFLEHDEIDESKVVFLKQIVDETDAKIVLSSTWRDLDDNTNKECYKMYKYLTDVLAKYGLEIISKTKVLSQNRPLEIKTWVDGHDNIESFVSLDDDFSRNSYDKYGIGDNLVYTIFFTDDLSVGGLQDKHVKQAIKILNSED